MKIAVGEERNERDSAPMLALSRKTSKWARNHVLSSDCGTSLSWDNPDITKVFSDNSLKKKKKEKLNHQQIVFQIKLALTYISVENFCFSCPFYQDFKKWYTYLCYFC